VGLHLFSQEQTPERYRTLSDAPVTTQSVVNGTIRVVPDARMTLADWDTLLHSLQLRTVNGPNNVGAYTVAPRDNTYHSTLQQTVQTLRTKPGIRLAEPVSTP
ncbi:MAG TPA: zf-HC2 domain-containing protein, partial [Xylella taiwanensis]